MKIVYYTSGLSGYGRLVRGLAIEQALRRRGSKAEFTILHSAPDSRILGETRQHRLPLESAVQTGPARFRDSEICKHLIRLGPDVLIVDLLWIPVHHLLPELPCKKIFLTRQVEDRFFLYSYKNISFSFDASRYDRVIAIEPYPCSVTAEHIDPIVIRNQNEILSRPEAATRLGLDPNGKNCLISTNAEPPAAEVAARSYSRLREAGYRFFQASLFAGGIFPIVDYFNAFDHVICGGGYNAFWEAIYFDKQADFIPMPTRFESQLWRIEHCRTHRFTGNGADELASIIENIWPRVRPDC